MFYLSKSVILVFISIYLYVVEPECKEHMKKITICICSAVLFYLLLRLLVGIASPSFHIPKAITGINYLSCIVQPSQCPAAMPEPSDLNIAGVFVFLLLSAWVFQKRDPVALLGFGFFLISIILASSAQLSEGMAHRYIYGSLI